jgi:SAM-dependent methyltransferase
MTTQPTIIEATMDAPSSAAAFVGNIPELYDTHLGPHLFEFSAADLAARVASRVDVGSRVLEIACGTGIATEHLWRALDRGTEIVATDLNPAMLAYGRELRGKLPGVTWQQADALALPFEDNTFDATVCQYGVMFFPDRQAGVREMTRVTKPGGWVTLNVWDSFANNRFVELAQQVIDDNCAGESPQFLQVPFGDCDIAGVTARLENAGLVDVRAEVVRESVLSDPLSLAQGLIEGNPGVVELRRLASVETRAIVRDLAWAYRREFGESPCVIPMQEIVFCGRKPRD